MRNIPRWLMTTLSVSFCRMKNLTLISGISSISNNFEWFICLICMRQTSDVMNYPYCRVTPVSHIHMHVATYNRIRSNLRCKFIRSCLYLTIPLMRALFKHLLLKLHQLSSPASCRIHIAEFNINKSLLPQWQLQTRSNFFSTFFPLVNKRYKLCSARQGNDTIRWMMMWNRKSARRFCQEVPHCWCCLSSNFLPSYSRRLRNVEYFHSHSAWNGFVVRL